MFWRQTAEEIGEKIVNNTDWRSYKAYEMSRHLEIRNMHHSKVLLFKFEDNEWRGLAELEGISGTFSNPDEIYQIAQDNEHLL